MELDQNTYLKEYGTTINVIQTIIVYLYQHPSVTEIPLIPGKKDIVISKAQALDLISTFLAETNAPDNFIKEIENVNLPMTSRMARAMRFVEAKTTELLSPASALHKNLEEYNYMLNKRSGLAQETNNLRLQKAFQIRKDQYKQYHDSLFALENSLLGNTKEEKIASNSNLDKIVPPIDTISQEREIQLIKSLTTHIPEIAVSVATSGGSRQDAIKDSLTKIAKRDSEIDYLYLHIAGDNSRLNNFDNLLTLTTDRLKNNYDLTPQQIQKQQLEFVTSPVNTSLSTREIYDYVGQKTNNSKLAPSIFSTITTQAYESGKPISGQEIIAKAISSTLPNLPPDQKVKIQTDLETIIPDIEQELAIQTYEAKTKGYGDSTIPRPLAKILIPSEVNLAKQTGIKPSTITTNYREQDFFGGLTKDNLLKQHNASSLDEIISNELSKDKPNYTLIDSIQFYHTYQFEIERINQTFSPSFNPLKTYQWARYKTHQISGGIRRATTWANNFQYEAWNKVFEFEEKLPHNRAIKSYFNWRDKMIDRGGFLGFALNPSGAFSRFIETRTTSLIANFEGSTSFSGKLFHGVLKNFQRGSYTLGGFSRETARIGISKLYHFSKKALGNAGKKIGEGVLKLAGKFGMRAIAEGAIAVVTEGAGTILLALDLAWQATKGAINFIKKLFTNPEKIAEYIAKTGLGLYALYAFLKSLVPFLFNTGAVIGSIIGGFAGPAGAFIGGMIGGTLWHFGPSIISGVGSFFSSIGTALTNFVSSLGPTVAYAATSVATVSLMFSTIQQSAGIPAFEKPGLEGTSGSKYITIDKSATGQFDHDQHIPNNALNQTLSYSVEISAVEETLTNITITDTMQTLKENGTNTVNTEEKTLDSLSPGEKYTFFYTQKLDSSFADSYLINTVVVKATSSQGEEQKTKSMTISIGTPPILPAAQFAIRLAQAITNCYGTTVTIPDGGQCLVDIEDSQITQVVPTLVASAERFTYLQCVGFARAVMEGVGNSLEGREYAANYGYPPPPSGYQLITNINPSTPLPGDLFILGTNIVEETGHIGVVIGIAGNLVNVADANSNAEGYARDNGYIPIENIYALLRPISP